MINQILKQFDQYPGDNPDWGIISQNLETLPIQLLCFTCSTINAREMFSKQPERYVSLSPNSNNLEVDLPALKKFLKELDKNKVLYQLSVIIGNTDPYYIYTLSGNTCSFYTKTQFWKKFGFRWGKYKLNFANWLSQKLQNKNVRVISWYEFEVEIKKRTGISFERQFDEYLPKVGRYFDQSKFDWELQKMKQNFGKDKYFGLLPIPNDEMLGKWIRRKFTEYMIQGLWLKENFPNGILLQNEKPTSLRYEMYQPLIIEKYRLRLPNLFIFGVDNSGYA